MRPWRPSRILEWAQLAGVIWRGPVGAIPHGKARGNRRSRSSERKNNWHIQWQAKSPVKYDIVFVTSLGPYPQGTPGDILKFSYGTHSICRSRSRARAKSENAKLKEFRAKGKMYFLQYYVRENILTICIVLLSIIVDRVKINQFHRMISTLSYWWIMIVEWF